MREFVHEQLNVLVLDSTEDLAERAAADVAERLSTLLESRKEVNVVFSGAESQQEFHLALADQKGVDWSRVNVFAVDEFYAPNLDPAYAVSNQPKRDLYSKVNPKSVNVINFNAPDPEEERRRYEAIIRKNPPDIACLGIGISGHIAFNEPGQTTFDDTNIVRVIEVNEESKRQLMEDPNFQGAGEIPAHGITITLATLMRCPNLFVVVPYFSKAEVVRRFFQSEITERFPASVLKQKEGAVLYLDGESFHLAKKVIEAAN